METKYIYKYTHYTKYNNRHLENNNGAENTGKYQECLLSCLIGNKKPETYIKTITSQSLVKAKEQRSGERPWPMVALANAL